MKINDNNYLSSVLVVSNISFFWIINSYLTKIWSIADDANMMSLSRFEQVFNERVFSKFICVTLTYDNYCAIFAQSIFIYTCIKNNLIPS